MANNVLKTGMMIALMTGAATSGITANAQSAGPELIPEKVVRDGRDLRGVRIARPGALLFASFDTDGSLSVSLQEIADGAPKAFNTADHNKDGTLSIFEQQDWASALGSHDGPLANAVNFDANIDRRVTLEEFTAGLERIGGSYVDELSGEILFSNLILAPNGKRAKQDLDERQDKDALLQIGK